MKLFSEGKNYKLYQGSMLDMLEVIEPNSVDSIVTDPPYELGFMNKGWDTSGIAFQKETWEKCYTVLKSGGYLLAFGGTRTFHRIACAIEDAGFEIRDTIMWLYGSGFPKSMNLGLAIDKKNGVESKVIGHSTNGTGAQPNKLNNHTRGDTGIGYADGSGREFDIKQAQNEWVGWGTTLKLAYEPVIVARKPCEGSCIDNVLKYGVGGINIDACRIPTADTKNDGEIDENGRFPSNVILTYDDTDFDEVCGGMPVGGQNGSISKPYKMNNMVYGEYGHCNTWTAYADEGSAARYFYCAKASKKDRDEGLDDFKAQQKYYCDGRGNSLEIFGSTDGGRKPLKNIHPTVKPVDLMQYLVRLVTPPNGTVLDPFNGSGSTGKACMYENRERDTGYKYIGIELTPEYLPISDARISYVANQMKKRRLI